VKKNKTKCKIKASLFYYLIKLIKNYLYFELYYVKYSDKRDVE